MGCDYYTVHRWTGKDWEEDSTYFSEIDDEVSCLCTFPHNYLEGFDKDIVRSLAYLGASVVLNHHGEEVRNINADLPAWIKKDIDDSLNIKNSD